MLPCMVETRLAQRDDTTIYEFDGVEMRMTEVAFAANFVIAVHATTSERKTPVYWSRTTGVITFA